MFRISSGVRSPGMAVASGGAARTGAERAAPAGRTPARSAAGWMRDVEKKPLPAARPSASADRKRNKDRMRMSASIECYACRVKRRERSSFHDLRRQGARVATLVIAAALYWFIQDRPSFMDPDSFYHAKMALLMREHGPVTSFPWLPFTTLADAFADHHFLYHAALVPFVSELGPLVGTRAAAIVFAAAAIVMFQALLEAYGVPCA